MRDLKLIISELNGTHIGVLDLKESSDFGLKLTRSIASIKDISARKTTYSLDFKIPKTPNNNVLLFGMKNLNSTDKTILSKKRVRVYLEENEIERGFIKFHLSELLDTYTATFYGGNADWVDKITPYYLSDLDWSNLNEPAAGQETFTFARIDTINAGDSTNYDIVYPFIDRNNTGANSDLRPIFYVRKFFQRAFEKIGYTLTSNFLNSTFLKGDGADYKGLAFDPACVFTADETNIESTRANYSTNRILSTDNDPSLWTDAYVLGKRSAGVTTLSKLEGFFNVLIQDNGTTYNTSTGEYTVADTAYYTFDVDNSTQKYGYYLFGSWHLYNLGLVSPAVRHPPSITFYLVANNVSTTVIDGTILHKIDFNPLQANSNRLKGYANAGDVLTLWFEIDDDASGFIDASLNSPSLTNWKYSLGHAASINVFKAGKINLGDQYAINGTIPAKIKVIDLIKDFKTLFNLYFEPDFKNNTITIEPRDDYYQNIGNAENITSLIDYDSPITIDYKLPYKRNLIFSYKADSNDGYLKEWEKLNRRTYAQYTHQLGDRFDEGDTNISTSLISPTIQRFEVNSNIVSSIIRKHYEDNENIGKGINTNFNVRLFQVIRNQQFDEQGLPRRTNSPLVVTCALMEEYGNVATIDNKQLTFNGANGLVSQFWAKTIANLEDAAILSLKMKIDYYKFQSIDFSKPVFIEHPADIRGYYVYESIDNFDILKDEVRSVKLLRFKNYQPITIDTSQKTNINENTTNNQGDTPSPIFYVFDELTNPSYEIVYGVDGNGNLVPYYYI